MYHCFAALMDASRNRVGETEYGNNTDENTYMKATILPLMVQSYSSNDPKAKVYCCYLCVPLRLLVNVLVSA